MRLQSAEQGCRSDRAAAMAASSFASQFCAEASRTLGRSATSSGAIELGPAHCGSTPGVLVLSERERELLRALLPKGATLRLVDHLDAEELMRTSGCDIFESEHLASQGTRKGRAGRKAANAQPKHQPAMPAPRASAGSTPRRSTREHKTADRWHPLEASGQRAPPKRLKKTVEPDKSPRAPAKEPQAAQYGAAKENKRRNTVKEERVPGVNEEKRKEKKQRGRSGNVEQDQNGIGDRVDEADDAGGGHHVVTQQEKGELQAKLDQLDNDQLDRVIDFLKLDMADNLDGQEIQLDLDTLPRSRRLALIKFVDAELRKAAGTRVGSADAAAGMPLNSPAFPVMEPGATPLAAATPVASAMTPRRDQDSAVPAASAAKRQLAWEACSAREVQRQSHLREVREAASVGGTPQSLTPAAAEPLLGGALPAMPEMMLPPAATDAGHIQAAAMPPARAPIEFAVPPAAKPSVAAATAPTEATATPGSGATMFGTSGDSMLESTAEVLNMVDFGWM